MSYDLRRLLLHGLIEGIASTQPCELTALGRRTALFYSRAFNRVVLAYPKYPIPTAAVASNQQAPSARRAQWAMFDETQKNFAEPEFGPPIRRSNQVPNSEF
jgi:hypothetical protein